MDTVELLGFCAAALTTLSLLPQTIKTIRTRETQGLSVVMYSLFTLGVIFWEIYGIQIGSMPIIIANIITLVMSLIILYFIVTERDMRGLSPAEKALIPQSFANEITLDRIRFIDRAHSPFTIGRIVCRGYDLYWKNYPVDFTPLPVTAQALLMHELCHVWQYKTGRLSALRYLSSPAAWKYGYDFDLSKSFDDYPCERQADLLQDWHTLNLGIPATRHAKGSTPPTLAQINTVVPFEFDLKQPPNLQNSDAALA